MDPELVTRLTELVEKVGRPRCDMTQHRSDLERRRPLRHPGPGQSIPREAIRTWPQHFAPGVAVGVRSLAFRNAEHRKKPDESEP